MCCISIHDRILSSSLLFRLRTELLCSELFISPLTGPGVTGGGGGPDCCTLALSDSDWRSPGPRSATCWRRSRMLLKSVLILDSSV